MVAPPTVAGVTRSRMPSRPVRPMDSSTPSTTVMVVSAGYL